MQKYRANSRVLGLSVGDTFESDDPFYVAYLNNGMISKVDEAEAPAPPAEPVAPVEEPADAPMEPVEADPEAEAPAKAAKGSKGS